MVQDEETKENGQEMKMVTHKILEKLGKIVAKNTRRKNQDL